MLGGSPARWRSAVRQPARSTPRSPGDSLLVATNGRGGAGAGAVRIAMIAAWTAVHRAQRGQTRHNQHSGAPFSLIVPLPERCMMNVETGVHRAKVGYHMCRT